MEKHLSLTSSRRSPFTSSGVPSLIDAMLLDDTQDSKFRLRKINSHAGTAFLAWHAGLRTQRMIAEGRGTRKYCCDSLFFYILPLMGYIGTGTVF